MGKHNNVSVVRNSMMELSMVLYEQQLTIMRNVAMGLLRDAIETWDIENAYNNMTGNTRYSFISGVFYQGALKEMFTPWDVIEAPSGTESGDRPSAGYSFPGDTIWFFMGNMTYGEEMGASNVEHADELVKSTVLRYNSPFRFQKAEKGGSGPNDAISLMRGLSEKASRKGFTVMIGVGVPYAEYLLNTRRLHVLQDTFDVTKKIADYGINSVRKL